MHFKTFLSLGVNVIGEIGTETLCTCPFCNSDKLYVNTEEGLFDCKVCASSGNKYTFLSLFHQNCLNDTTQEDYQSLAEDRGIPPIAFSNAELSYDRTTGIWNIPVKNENDSIVNLRRYDKLTKKLIGLGGCSNSIYNLNQLQDREKVYICEGEWDAIAFQYVLDSLGITDAVALGVPGANTFKEEWSPFFAGREVDFLYDNDLPGQRGCDRAIRILRGRTLCKEVRKIVWPEGTPDKWDIRDQVTNSLDTIKECYDDIHKLLVVPTNQTLTKSYDTFNSVVEEFNKHIFLTEEMKLALLLEFAVIFSNKIPGDPLWCFIIGPPGAGKTLMLQTVSGTEYTHYESSLGPKTLVSGFKTSDGTDPSLLPKIISKTLIIKEYTEILGLPRSEQEGIFGVLRGAYDGRVERTYPHGVTRVYPDPNSGDKTCHFSVLAGVTNAIHGDTQAALGERFLKFQMFPDDYDPVNQIRSAISNTIRQEIPEIVLRDAAAEFIHHRMMRGVRLPSVPEWIQEKVIGLSQIVSVIRAIVPRKQGVLQYRPAAEVGTRLSKQLIKLGQCIAFVLGKNAVDEFCYWVMKRISMDTCYGWHRDAIMAIVKWYPEPVLKEQVSKDAIMSSSTTSRCLEDLYELGAIEFVEHKTGSQGNPAHLWKLSSLMEYLFQKSGIMEEPLDFPAVPREARSHRKTVAKPTIPQVQ